MAHSKKKVPIHPPAALPAGSCGPSFPASPLPGSSRSSFLPPSAWVPHAAAAVHSPLSVPAEESYVNVEGGLSSDGFLDEGQVSKSRNDCGRFA